MYEGALYRDSAKLTVKLLDNKKDIELVFYKKSGSIESIYIKITPLTTLNDIISQIFTIVPRTMGMLSIYLDQQRLTGTSDSWIFYYGINSKYSKRVLLDFSRPLYAIKLPLDNKNLYSDLNKISWHGYN